MKDVVGTINDYIVEARKLYKKLYLEVYPLNNEEDAKRYLEDSNRYKFLAKLFADMMIINWLRKDYTLKGRFIEEKL